MAPKRIRPSFNTAADQELFRAVDYVADVEGKSRQDLIREILREALEGQIESLRRVPPRTRKAKPRLPSEGKD